MVIFLTMYLQFPSVKYELRWRVPTHFHCGFTPLRLLVIHCKCSTLHSHFHVATHHACHLGAVVSLGTAVVSHLFLKSFDAAGDRGNADWKQQRARFPFLNESNQSVN